MVDGKINTHRILRMPRHPKLIKNGWEVDHEMKNQPKVVSLNADGKTMNFQFPDHFIWCRMDLGPLPLLTTEANGSKL